MAQTLSKTTTRGASTPPAASSSRARKLALAGGVCAVAMLSSQYSYADFQVETRYSPDSRTTVVRRIKPLNFSVSRTPDGSAPGNDCPGSAFEVLNPSPWELACVGYVAPKRLP